MTLIAVLLSLAVGERMQRGVFDGWQKVMPRDLSGTDVRVVMIDDFSIQMIGPWPWSRYYLARLTEELKARGAKVVAFDMMFPEHDRVSPETLISIYPELSPAVVAEVQRMQPTDQIFSTVIGQSPVVLGHAGVERAPEEQPQLADAPITGKLPSKIDTFPAELASIPELDEVALGTGLMNGRPDNDGVVRDMPLILRVGSRPRLSLSAEIARNAVDAESVKSTPAALAIGHRKVPVDAHGRVRLHFGRFPSDRIISAARILGDDKPLKADVFKGKPVIVGMTAEGTADIAATPLNSVEFGPLIQAQSVDTILRGGWLQRPRWAPAAEWAAAAMLAFLALGNALFGRGYRFLLAIVFAALPVASWLLFENAGLLLDPARPALVGLGSVAGVAMGLFALARIERERLRDALVHERVAAAETQGELQAARAIQLGMVPARTRLQKLDPRVDLDALLEPAKSVGGDFYDAMMIGPDRLGFAVADVTGKGVPAALFMAMSKALTSAALSRMQVDVAGMADAVNLELLKDNSEAMSVTMLLGILDLKSGAIELVCAGHEDPLRLDSDGNIERLKLDGGPPFSIAEFPFPLEKIQLQPGETLVLVTDGVTEAQNAAEELFGRDRILGGKDAWARSATAICEAVRDEVRNFEAGTEATDDLTVMAIRYIGG
nr:CHASE2 domain-containing protein [Sphingomonas alba]